jgi:agmatine deiminase
MAYMKKHILSLGFTILIFCCAHAQKPEVPYEFMTKYHMMDSTELFAPKNVLFTSTPPPAGIVRAVAEWEPMMAVMVSAYDGGGSNPVFGLPMSLIASMSADCHVITIVEKTSHMNAAINTYTTNGVNLANCSFLIASIDSYWCRDYAPWFIMVNNSEISIIDFPYNRTSRPNDNMMPVHIASYLNRDLYGMNVLHTGGNFMCTGTGVAAMTDLVEDENPLSTAQIDTMFKQYMGITKNYITTDPLGDYIKHIDCWGKFLGPDKILIGRVPTNHSRYVHYEAMAAYWANEISDYGTNYRVYRTYSAYEQPYTNSLILNKKVFVPFRPNYNTSNNNAKLVYEQAMPGYQIIGIPYSGWAQTDALHCRTHEIADTGMLYIAHQPVLQAQPLLSQYMIHADIYALSGFSIHTDSVWVRYKINNGTWTRQPMSFTSGNHWQTTITGLVDGDTAWYYIHAEDQSPRIAEHPVIGEPDPHKFWVPATTFIPETDKPLAITFPNPANEDLFIQMKDCSAGALIIRLFDILGNEVIGIHEQNTCSRMFRINVRELKPGYYLLHIGSNGRSLSKKVMVMH